MPKLKDVCRYVRSKNAGPFWVTIDLFFDGPETYQRHRDDPAISVDAVALLYGVEARVVRRFEIDALNVIKISIPRSQPKAACWSGICTAASNSSRCSTSRSPELPLSGNDKRPGA